MAWVRTSWHEILERSLDNRKEQKFVGMRAILVGVFLFSVLISRAQQITVRSFKSDDIDFRDYRSYFWAAHAVDQLDEGSYLLHDLLLKADIREAIHEELEFRGYRRLESGADVLVNFRMFSKPVTLRGYEGYGNSYWRNDEISSIDIGEEEIKIEAGTLIISLVERSSGKLIWQGTASGLDTENEIVKVEGKIREAVALIFDRYSNRTSEYTKR